MVHLQTMWTSSPRFESGFSLMSMCSDQTDSLLCDFVGWDSSSQTYSDSDLVVLSLLRNGDGFRMVTYCSFVSDDCLFPAL